jgi:hypothetical protein
MEKLGKEFRYAKPREGLLVRFPRTHTPLPTNGAVVPWIGPDGRFWRRRLRCGDIELITQLPEKTVETKIIKKKTQEGSHGY